MYDTISFGYNFFGIHLIWHFSKKKYLFVYWLWIYENEAPFDKILYHQA